MKEDDLDDLILKEVERASRRDGITTHALVRAAIRGKPRVQITSVFQRIDWLEQHGFIYRRPLHPRSRYCFTWRIT